jgi:hypothetical protein
VRPRWDIDVRGRGVGDARRLVPAAEALLDRMREQEWVTEDPDAHLLPHFEELCERDDLPLELVDWTIEDDATLSVNLRLTGEWDGKKANLAAFALFGTVVEPGSFIDQREGPDWLELDIVTGVVSDAGQFAPHGHTLRLRVGA